ncbi:MAG: hypothetical protein WC818_22890 [Pseudomonas sp.]|jgi:hypothetical protein|uniref:hypothetical protein n=1 Tax=Pseudomonas sp. TaxID=306 RepID=UPI003561748F
MISSAQIITPKSTEFMLGDKETENATIGMTVVNAHDLITREDAVVPTFSKVM